MKKESQSIWLYTFEGENEIFALAKADSLSKNVQPILLFEKMIFFF